MDDILLPILIFALCAAALSLGLLAVAAALGPRRQSAVKQMPYESGMDPIHDAHRKFDVRFHLVAIAFLVFDVELLFLYPWAVTSRDPNGIDAAVGLAAAAADPLGCRLNPVSTTFVHFFINDVEKSFVEWADAIVDAARLARDTVKAQSGTLPRRPYAVGTSNGAPPSGRLTVIIACAKRRARKLRRRVAPGIRLSSDSTTRFCAARMATRWRVQFAGGRSNMRATSAPNTVSLRKKCVRLTA